MMLSIQPVAATAAALALVALTGPAGAADPLTLVQDPVVNQNIGPNPLQTPCIISGQSCPASGQGSFAYANFTQGGSIGDFDVYTTSNQQSGGTALYTVSYLSSALGTSAFDIGIDVNTTGAKSETLDLFQVLVDGVVQFEYSGGGNIGQFDKNGNGWADWTLASVDLSSFGANATVVFHAVWSNAVDGYESFFLTPTAAIPEPGTYALMLVGLGFAGYAARRRRVG
jgi:hypothetical protein